jgi:hypothetical protein
VYAQECAPPQSCKTCLPSVTSCPPFFLSLTVPRLPHRCIGGCHCYVVDGVVFLSPGLVWMGCGVFAAVLLWGGRLLAAGHQSSNAVRRCW